MLTETCCAVKHGIGTIDRESCGNKVFPFQYFDKHVEIDEF